MAKEVQIVGLKPIFRRIDKKFQHMETAIRKSIATDAKIMHKRIYQGLGGSATKSSYGMYKRGKEAGAGTGTEIFPPGQVSNIINVRTGRMRSSLSSEVSYESWDANSGGPVSQVGWDSGYRSPDTTAMRYAVDWPAKRLVAGRIRRKKKSLPGSFPPSRIPPTIYVGWVLVGTDKIVGRNVLRMALVDNIRKRKTLKRLESALQKVVERGSG